MTTDKNIDKSSNSTPYLTFKVQDSSYAIDVLAVQSIVWLPELTPLAESPDYVVGVVNYRGDILHVIDLDIRFGYTSLDYQTTDKVIVIKHDTVLMGIIVNEVYDIQNISEQDFESSPSYGEREVSSHHFVTGVVKADKEIMMVINYKNLLLHSYSDDSLIKEHKLNVPIAKDENEIHDETHLTKHPNFCPDASQKERDIYRNRAIDLMENIDRSVFADVISLAIIDLKGEYYGVELGIIREFSECHNLISVPCCPDYIIGNMNVRGDIITLVDISGMLNLPASESIKGKKIIILKIDDIEAGIPVDGVTDVAVLNHNEINPVPVAVQTEQNEYLKGTIFYKEKVVSILNIKKIFTNDGFAINEEV